MKKQKFNVSTPSSVFDLFATAALSPRQLLLLKGGHDGSDDIIIIEDPIG